MYRLIGVSPNAVTRRRGQALIDAVYAATLDEIAEHGLRGASMDRIAQRAATGKASLYRRWPNVRALALDTFITTLVQNYAHDFPDTGDLRGDLQTSLTGFAEAMKGDLGVVLRELASEAAHDPQLVASFQERFGLAQQARVVAGLQRAMARGQIPIGPIDPFVLELPAAFVVHRMLMLGSFPTSGDCAHFIDAVVLPLLGYHVESAGSTTPVSNSAITDIAVAAE